MKRRDFLKGLAAIPALAALPVLAKTDDEFISNLIEKDFVESVDKSWKALDFPTANSNRMLTPNEITRAALDVLSKYK